MRFSSEIDLVKTLKSTLIHKYSNEFMNICDEVSLGYGIADIVISQLNKPIQEIPRSTDILNITDIAVYKLIQSNGKVSFDSIYDKTRASKQVLSSSLKKLINLEYINNFNDGFLINKSYDLLFVVNFAVEAKLKDWKRALKQAFRYKWFAEYSYVVMDEHYITPAIKNIESFKKFNVGLSSINTNGELIRHFKPERQKPLDEKMHMLLSEKIKLSLH